MDIVPHTVVVTKDFVTSRSGLVAIATLIKRLGLTDWVRQYFPKPGSNRGYPAHAYVNTFILMLHEGAKCLEDSRHLRDDEALKILFANPHIPSACALGDWLRRLGKENGIEAISQVNRQLLSASLGDVKQVTLDIDATFIASKKKAAEYSYTKQKGYMPIVGHIMETGQVIYTEMRDGNVPPSKENLEVMHACERLLPEGVKLGAVRMDAAGYQAAILNDCLARNIAFAIRAKMDKSLKATITNIPEEQWKPIKDNNNNVISESSTTRITHSMEKSTEAFELIIERTPLSTTTNDEQDAEDALASGDFMYRAIAVSGNPSMSDKGWIAWYNQRGEHSENRLKELKTDFAASSLPCSDFAANALYFWLCALAYNLFALLRRHYFPAHLRRCRAKTVRCRLYAVAGKVVRHARGIVLKLSGQCSQLLKTLLDAVSSAPPQCDTS